MQDQHLFEYAVIRIVPRVEREEFFNAGIIIFCKKHNHLQIRIELNEEKCFSLFPETDIEDIRKHLSAFVKIAEADISGGPIAELDAASRFRWLTAKRSTIIQTSAVHPGISSELDKTLKRLIDQVVL